MHTETLGNKRYLIPLVAFAVIASLMATILYPVVTSSPKDIPLAIISLDEGAKTPAGSMNIGETIVDEITQSSSEADNTDASGAGDNSDNQAVSWTVLANEAELTQSNDENLYYATIIIPEDFTATQVAAQMAAQAAAQPQAGANIPGSEGTAATEGTQAPDAQAQTEAAQAQAEAAQSAATQAQAEVPEVSPITIVIDQGKNPAIAQTIEQMLGQNLSQKGVLVEFEYLNPVGDDLGQGSIAQQMTYMLVVIISIISSILLFVFLRPEPQSTKSNRLKALLIQILYAIVLAICLGWFIPFFIEQFAGYAIPFAETFLFVFIASLSFMLLILCFFAWATPLGILALITLIVCGLTTALLPYELLPEFWQTWLYPWIPERFVADGIRQVYYMGTSAWNSASMTLSILGVSAVIVLLLSSLKPSKHSAE